MAIELVINAWKTYCYREDAIITVKDEIKGCFKSFETYSLLDIFNLFLKVSKESDGYEILKAPKALLKDERVSAIKQFDIKFTTENSFVIKFNNKFEEWLTEYYITRKSSVNNLSRDNFDFVHQMLFELEQAIEFAVSCNVEMRLDSEHSLIKRHLPQEWTITPRRYLEGCQKALTYLKRMGAVKDFKISSIKGDHIAEVALDMIKFEEIRITANKVFNETLWQRLAPYQKYEGYDDETSHGDEEKVLFVTYYKGEIALNGVLVIAKPSFNGENDLIMTALIHNPFKTFTREELSKKIGTDINKDFFKVVENLGFRKDLSRVFFDLSKTDIKFYNPITGLRLDQIGLNKPRI